MTNRIPEEIALERIKQAAQNGSTELDLSRLRLTTLPAEIGQLTNLTRLDLDWNRLTSWPAEIGQLANLTSLVLRSNPLSSLPAEIGQLANLTLLDLSSNRLTSLPAEIGQLTNLTSLNLYGNRLTSLPAEIGQLTNLTRLDLYGNPLTSWPAEIGQLTNLTTLDLDWNRLTSLPSEIGQLTNLTTLDLSDNQLSSLPTEIGQLTNLTSLNLYGNRLTSLPAEIGQLTNLTSLNLYGNRLTSLPAEIGRLTNLTRLELSSNGLTSLPVEIGQLANLTMLDLSSNGLTSLPAGIGQLTNLTRIELSSNGLTSLPAEIGQLANLTRIDLRGNPSKTLPDSINKIIKLYGNSIEFVMLKEREYREDKIDGDVDDKISKETPDDRSTLGREESFGIPDDAALESFGLESVEAPAPPARYANYELYQIDEYQDSIRVEEGHALRAENWYDLEVWIAPEIEGKPLGDEKGARQPIRDPNNPETVPIYVWFEVDQSEFELEDDNTRLQIIKLPPRKASTKASLRLRPRQPSLQLDMLSRIEVRFLYNFSVIESIGIDLEIVPKRKNPSLSRFALAAPIRATYLPHGDWVQIEDVPRRELAIIIESKENDRYELTFCYSGLEYRGSLRLTKEAIEDLIVRIRAKLEFLAVGPDSPIEKQIPREIRKEVRELATLGGLLWTRLFAAEENKSLWHIGEFLKKFPVKDEGAIQIIINQKASGFVFPWNLLYDGEFPMDPKATVGELLKGFWGMRYSIEQLPRMVRPDAPCKPIQLDKNLNLSFMLREELPNSAKQILLMADLSRRSLGKIIVGPPISRADDLGILLENNDSHILYFYSIGYTRRRQADIAYVPASEPDRSYIELSGGRVYLEALELARRNIKLRKDSTVILNMCEGAQITPSISEGFVPFFLDKGAISVVGTECPMTTDFAHPFSEAVFEFFLRGNSFGKSLLKARCKFLAQDDPMAPLGLAYTLSTPSRNVPFSPK